MTGSEVKPRKEPDIKCKTARTEKIAEKQIQYQIKLT